MKARITRAERQKIVKEFQDRHGGRYDPRAFMEEVRATKGQHPAWSWFTWDDDKAAEDHRVWEARVFAQDVVIQFTVEQIRRGNVVVIESEAPAFISPVDLRGRGGGYFEFDPNDPVQVAVLCDEAARSLHAWIRRYGGAVIAGGGTISAVEKLARQLDNASEASAA